MSGRSFNIFKDIHVCPWWFSFFLDNLLRPRFHDPEKILSPYVKEGNVAADIGCGPGYFSPTMARLVGESGRVVCIDLQRKMLDRARWNAERAGMANRMEFRQCSSDSLMLSEKLDFALTFWMVHEVPDPESFFRQIYDALKPGGRYLLVEPKMHVTRAKFERQCAIAGAVGFVPAGDPMVSLSRGMVFGK